MIYGDIAESLIFRRNQLLLKLLVKWNTPAQGCKFRTTNLGHIWLNESSSITQHSSVESWKLWSLKSDDISTLCICMYIIYHIYIYIIFWYTCFSMLMALSSSFHWVSLLGGVEKSCRVWHGVLGFQLRSSNEWSKISSSSHDFFVGSSTAKKPQNPAAVFFQGVPKENLHPLLMFFQEA